MRIAGLLLCAMSLFLSCRNSGLPAPVYADPVYCGSCDPEVVWNAEEQLWYMFYTGRRPALGVAATCGNPIGVAVSQNLKDWTFKGYCRFDGEGGEPDCEHTFWAPALIIRDGRAHMFVTYKEDATPPWGTGGCIAHYTAPADDMVNGWERQEISVGEDDCLDACVVELPDGMFRMYYVGRDETLPRKSPKTIRYAESRDLVSWTVFGDVKGDVNDRKAHPFAYQEGVFVIRAGSRYYMVADPHKGLSTYSSDDGITWKYHGQIMEEGWSQRTLDRSQARHPSVVRSKGKLYIIYHTEPFRPEGVPGSALGKHQRYAFIQIAELRPGRDGHIEPVL